MSYPLNTAIRTSLAALLISLAFMASAQESDEDPPGNVVEIWTVHLKPGAQVAFESAIRAHMPLRKQNGEPFTWNTFTPHTGAELASYYFRHCCFAWSDRDAWDQWNADNPQVDADWQENVDPHVASYEHHFETVDFANSHWPNDSEAVRFVGVTTFTIAPGSGQAFNEAKGELSQIAINEGWASDERRWAWVGSVNGPQTVSLAIPYSGYADMTEPDPSFYEFLAEKIGAEKAGALFGQLTAATDGSEYQIYTSRPDLSTPD